MSLIEALSKILNICPCLKEISAKAFLPPDIACMVDLHYPYVS